jgi:hypothetical protein
MKCLCGALLFLVFLSPEARSTGLSARKPGLYGVLGLEHRLTSFKGDNNHSEFSGWGYNAEAGVDFVSNSNYGLNLAVIFRQGDEKNEAANETNVEIAESSGYGAKTGIIVSFLTFGVGVLKTEFDSRRIGTTGTSTENVSGQDTFLYANVAFDIASKYRSMVELSYAQGQSNGVNTATTTISLKIGILESSR